MSDSSMLPDDPPPGVDAVFISDAARRASDIINEKRLSHDWDDIKNKWIAIRLTDGGSDGILYDSKKDAIRFQLHEQQCMYIAFVNLMGGSKPGECERLLTFHRMMYDAGMRLTDPEDINGGLDILPTAARYDDFKDRQFPVANRAERRRLSHRERGGGGHVLFVPKGRGRGF